MEFCKYQGAGNDFVIVDNTGFFIAQEDIPGLAAGICDRRFGVGADGFILAELSDRADIRMNFYNADGSEASMCGNGIRCFAKFVTDHSIIDKEAFSVETGDGIKHIEVLERTLQTTAVRVDMGTFSNMREVKSCGFDIVSMTLGVPHAVIFCDDPGEEMSVLDGLAEENGSALEHAAEFAPERTNVNFVKLLADKVSEGGRVSRILCSTWERGAGKTLACGTGACSSAVAAHLTRGLSDRIIVTMPGGEVTVTVKSVSDRAAAEGGAAAYMIYMEGTAVLTFKGEYSRSW